MRGLHQTPRRMSRGRSESYLPLFDACRGVCVGLWARAVRSARPLFEVFLRNRKELCDAVEIRDHLFEPEEIPGTVIPIFGRKSVLIHIVAYRNPGQDFAS